jgi:hypothetical protein
MKTASFLAPTCAALLFVCGCEDKEKLCRAIAETRLSALQPRDRIYWEENCRSPPPEVSKAEKAVADEAKAIEERRQKRFVESKARLAKMGEPFVAVAKTLTLGDDEKVVQQAAASLAKPTVSREKEMTTVIWRLEQDTDRCVMMTRFLVKRLRRVSVECTDILLGDRPPEQLFLNF